MREFVYKFLPKFSGKLHSTDYKNKTATAEFAIFAVIVRKVREFALKFSYILINKFTQIT